MCKCSCREINSILSDDKMCVDYQDALLRVWLGCRNMGSKNIVIVTESLKELQIIRRHEY